MSLQVCVLVVALIVIVGTQTGSAIKCVECNSYYESWCEDLPGDFNYTMDDSNKYHQFLTDCDDKTGGEVNGVPFTMCRKMKQTVGDDSSRVIRMCAAHGENDKCYDRTGTRNIKLSYCTCKGDWCNNAPTMFSSKLVLLSIISATLALISYS